MEANGMAMLIKPWAELSLEQVEALFRLRQDVFVVEQQCPYPDLDGFDPRAWHMTVQVEGVLAGCCRIFRAGEGPPFHPWQEPDDGLSARVGRFATAGAFRGKGYGLRMMQEALAFAAREKLGSRCRIAAQRYAEPYYARLGFASIGAPYDEDGIEHIDMIAALPLT
jgi:ElaA protein